MSRLKYTTNGTILHINDDKEVETFTTEAFSKIANYDNNNNNCYVDASNNVLKNKIVGITNERSCINKASQDYNTIGYQSNEHMCWGANYNSSDKIYKDFVNERNKVQCDTPNSMNVYQYSEPVRYDLPEVERNLIDTRYNDLMKNYDIVNTNTNNYNTNNYNDIQPQPQPQPQLRPQQPQQPQPQPLPERPLPQPKPLPRASCVLL
jgi:hypothetical protein